MSEEIKSNSLSRVYYKEFDIYIDLYIDRIDIFEASTGMFLRSRQLSKDYSIKKLLSAKPDETSWLNKDNETVSATTELLELQSKILTTDQYIFSIQYDTNFDIGAHFGFYGWGLFIIKSNKINSLFSQEVEKLMTGQIIKQGNKIQILLGYENGLIESYEIDPNSDISKFNPGQNKLWKTTDEHGIRSLVVYKNMLISTHVEGYLKVRTLDSGQIIRSIKVTGDKIMCIASDEKYCFIGTWEGTAAALDTENWKVMWKKQLSDQPLVGCTLLKDGLCFVDNGLVKPVELQCSSCPSCNEPAIFKITKIKIKDKDG